jgi:hypothetical protein
MPKYLLSGGRSLDKKDLDVEIFNMVLEAAEGQLDWEILKDYLVDDLEMDTDKMTPEQFKSLDLAIELASDALARVRKAILGRYH